MAMNTTLSLWPGEGNPGAEMTDPEAWGGGAGDRRPPGAKGAVAGLTLAARVQGHKTRGLLTRGKGTGLGTMLVRWLFEGHGQLTFQMPWN